MLRKIGQLAGLTGLSAVMLLGVTLVASSHPFVGTTSEAGTGGLPLAAYDSSTVPQSVIDDAGQMAEALFSDSQEKAGNFANQVLAMYTEAIDKDFIIVFNSGGWGWNLLENSRGWDTIFVGIEDKLDNMGYKSIVLDYKRTGQTWRDCLKEVSEIANFYPSKAEDLVNRVQFLTEHIPDVKIIVAGESTGTVISDKVMTMMKENPQVYTIQTGPPFWHKQERLERALVLTSNGILPDSFSQGDIMGLITVNMRSLCGLPQVNEGGGTVLRYFRAPGHEYWWQHPDVCTEINRFLEVNFSIDH